MIKEKIKKLALANGFKLKVQDDGSLDLNPYVYDFAKVLLGDKDKRIAELEKANSKLKEPIDLGERITFTKQSLEAHNLEQREESVANFCCWLIDNGEPIPEEQIQKYGSDYIIWARDQAKALKGGKLC